MQLLKNLKNLLQFSGLFIFITFLLFIYVIFFTKIIQYKSIYNDSTNYIVGTIKTYSINGNKLSMELKAKEKIITSYYIKTEEEKNYLLNNICIGCTVKLNGETKELLNNTIPNTFNYKNYLYNKKIYKSFTISKYKIIKNNNILNKMKDYLYKKTINLKCNDYLLLFVLGDKSLLDSSTYNEFQINGVAHLLAISGMHIGVLIKILDVLLKKFKEKKKLFIISFILIIFAFITNFAAAILRAILFYILLNIKKIFNLRINNFKLLLITAFILIIINPFIIYDVGFIYSFVITGGIILNSKYIKGNYVKKLLLLSVISFLYSLPITALLNYEINITSIIANLIFVPFVSVIVYPVSLITYIVPFIHPIFTFLIFILEFLNHIFVKFSILINIPKMPIILIILYYILLLLLIKYKKNVVGLIGIIVISKMLPKLDSNYYVYYLDVGQGDSSVIVSPYKKEIVMIDTGGKLEFSTKAWQKSTKKFNISDNSIKFLKSIGITKLDYLILSHGDEDHAGEANNIKKHLKVKNIVLNKGEYNKLEKTIINKNVTDEYNLKTMKIESLSKKMYDNENDNSTVNLVSINKFNLLFLGDAPKMVEEDIFESINEKNIDFIKLGHHGSKTSTSELLVSGIKSKLNIISSGRNNRYNHPSKETITLLNKYKRKYLNTQTSGTIILKIKNNKYSIKEIKP
ncbi:MAG: DNA internalization-related competence protein ComEC/Rec2 [Bacilli bacterium]